MIKKNGFVIAFLCLLSMFSFIDHVAAQQIIDLDEPLLGTWQNDEYTKDFRQIYYSSGRVESYNKNKQTVAEYVGQFIIEEKWQDQDNNYWYHLSVEYAPGGIISNKWLTTLKIDATESSLEFEEDRTSYPSVFSEYIGDKYHHKILYRCD